MGKLADLWASYKSESAAAKKQEIRQEIWKIEDWMISKGYKKQRTDFKALKETDRPRFVSERDGGHNIPQGAKTGRDRCRACIYNFKAYCDPNDPFGHMARV